MKNTNPKYTEFRTGQGDLARIEDSDASAGSKARVRRIGIVEEWFNRGVITKLEYSAAEQFGEDYERAKLMPRYASMNFDEVRGGSNDDFDEIRHKKYRNASNRVNEIFRLVGQRASAPLVAIVGEGGSMRAFAKGGTQAAEVKGQLCTAFEIIAAYYKLKGVL